MYEELEDPTIPLAVWFSKWFNRPADIDGISFDNILTAPAAPDASDGAGVHPVDPSDVQLSPFDDQEGVFDRPAALDSVGFDYGGDDNFGGNDFDFDYADVSSQTVAPTDITIVDTEADAKIDAGLDFSQAVRQLSAASLLSSQLTLILHRLQASKLAKYSGSLHVSHPFRGGSSD